MASLGVPESEQNRIDLKLPESLGVGPSTFSFPQVRGSLTMATAPMDGLNMDLASLREQVEQLKGDVAGKHELAAVNERLDKMAASIQSASQRSRELKANVLLPPSEDLSVQLVPSYWLDRLEEYRADEKKGYVLLGAFLGGVIGILSNWATQETFVLTKAAGVLIFMFVLLGLALSGWVWQINKRVRRVKDTILSHGSLNPSHRAGDKGDADSTRTQDETLEPKGGENRE
jgi:hypothetical protein